MVGGKWGGGGLMSLGTPALVEGCSIGSAVNVQPTVCVNLVMDALRGIDASHLT